MLDLLQRCVLMVPIFKEYTKVPLNPLTKKMKIILPVKKYNVLLCGKKREDQVTYRDLSTQWLYLKHHIGVFNIQMVVCGNYVVDLLTK